MPGLGSATQRRPRRFDVMLHHAILLAGLAGVIVSVELVVLLVLGRFPSEREGTVVAVSMIAAAAAALLFQPARARLEPLAGRFRSVPQETPDDVLRALGGRLTYAMPLDELLLELVEALRRGLGLETAEIWTGSAGLLERATSDPDRGWASLSVTPAEEAVIARAQTGGATWIGVWLPSLLEARAGAEIRIAPIAHAEQLLGFIVAERAPGSEPFGLDEDRVLVELARQLALALRNVRLDSQLEASLDEVRRQAEQLRESRARVVSAADAERRRIERDLHDGAQQQLITLMVNLRLARELAGSAPAEATEILEQLGHDAEAAVDALRELAHGIYPPLLADRGLPDALSAVAARAPVRARLVEAAVDRQPPQVEATVYFCCLEALQNAGKHAGDRAIAALRVWEEQGALLFEVADDGVGFDPDGARHGAGLSNMTDRLGAIGGSLRIESAPGAGTRVTGRIPLGR
jgi:signal transduction histidine kinase